MIAALLRWKLPVLLIAAALIRMAIFVAFPSIFAFDQTGVVHGSTAYDTYAVNLIETGVYGAVPGVPDANIPPLYSYALAGVYGLFGRSALTVAVFHTLMDVISMALLYDIARRLFRQHGAWIGWWAGVFYAVYPYLIFQNLTLIDTPFFMLLLNLFMWLIVRVRDDERSWRWAVLAGVALGLATLARPILPFLAVLLPIWFLLRRSLVQTITRLAVVALISVLMLVPWFIRNYAVYDQFVAMSVTTWANFYHGNNPLVIPLMRAGYDTQWTSPDITTPDPNSPAADAERAAVSFAFLRENTALIPELWAVKVLAYWSIDIFPRYNPTAGPDPDSAQIGDSTITISETGEVMITGLPEGDPVTAYSTGEFQAGRVIHRFYFGGLLFLALIGVLLTRKQWRDVSLLWLIQLSMTAAYVLFHPSTRYRVPTDPYLFMFSAAAVVLVWRWVRMRGHHEPA
jgi:4-amino-4-deoxy-L-arabinose transferase-like glycosyltransferase